MKKQNTHLAVILFSFFLPSTLFSQAMASLNLVSPLSLEVPAPPIAGFGFEMSVYSPEIKIVGGNRFGKPTSMNTAANQPKISVRFGGELMLSSMGSRYLKDMPLVAPETGNALVSFNNALYSANICSKFYFNYCHGKFIPYTEAFAGYRGFESDMTIQPNDNSSSTEDIIATTEGFDFGGSAGFLFRLTNDCFLDVGGTFSHSEVEGNYVDLPSVSNIAGTADFHLGDTPADFLIFKLGITGYIDGIGVGCGHSSFLGHGHSCGHIGGGASHIHIHVH